MIILSISFLFHGFGFIEALRNGIFLAISAFCNAGFVLNNTGIIEYQTSPVILYTIAILALLGATSPAVSVVLPKWFKGHKLPPQYIIVINTTLILIIILILSQNICLKDPLKPCHV